MKNTDPALTIFEECESNVRAYCRSFPCVFGRAKGSIIYSESGAAYIDFVAGAGALNYGHNHEVIKQRLIQYLTSDSIVHGLDMHTSAKQTFLEKFKQLILKPRDLDYKVQFCGPTGANAVEAALKLSRKVKKRTTVFSFMGGYHGMSLGSLSASGNLSNREAAGVPLTNIAFMPFPFGFMSSFDSIEYLTSILNDTHSGIEKPAAIVFETVQAEGGIIIAPQEWMRRLRRLCDEHDILLICDDIQVGCGRTGPFLSFERAGIVPDIVLLSKSISGYGGPMSILLLKPELDIWMPAEHNGTFRGYQLAFVGATAALEFMQDNNLEHQVKLKGDFIGNFLSREVATLNGGITIRGLGMIWGIDVSAVADVALAQKIVSRCYELGLLVERVGRDGKVIKIMPPLTTEMEILKAGCGIIKRAITDCLNGSLASA